MQRSPPSKWRNIVYSQWVFTGICVIVWFFLPESPRWLVEKGRYEDAAKVVQRLYGRGNPEFDPEAQIQVLIRENALSKAHKEETRGGTYLQIFQGTNRVSLVLWDLAHHAAPYSHLVLAVLFPDADRILGRVWLCRVFFLAIR